MLVRFLTKARVPAGFEHGNEGLDFLKNVNSYYHYPYGLYSAGHAHLDITKSHADEPMIQDRDRNVVKVMLGDSGGFQIATGVMKMDWANAKDPNDPVQVQQYVREDTTLVRTHSRVEHDIGHSSVCRSRTFKQ